MINKKRVTEQFQKIAVIAVASSVFAAGFNMFLLPHGVVLGGATGVATLLNIFFGAPIGLTSVALNLPLLISYGIACGWRRIPSALIGIFSTSIALDLLTFFPSVTDDLLVASIFGGAVMGIGVGILLRLGITTGGSDLAAYILHRKFRRVSVGRFTLLIDGAIIIGSAVALGHLSGLFYSIVAATVYSVTVDRTLIGVNRAKLVYIISSEPDEIAQRIVTELSRGVTLLYGKGKYTDSDRRVVMCALKSRELYSLKRIIGFSDPRAFMIITDANEVFGEGFGNNNS